MLYREDIVSYIKDNNQKGFTVLESLITIAIVVFLFTVSIISYRSYDNDTILQSQVDQIVVHLSLARQKTISSHEDDSWGIKFSTSTVPQSLILFKGANYEHRASSSGQALKISPKVLITDLDFGGSDEVVFKRVSGRASTTGYIDLQLINDPSYHTTVYLNQEGLTSMQPFDVLPANEKLYDSRHMHVTYTRVIDTSTEDIKLTFDGGTVVQNIVMNEHMVDGQFVWSEDLIVDGSTQVLDIRTHRINDPDTIFSIQREVDKNNKSLGIDISGDTWVTPQLIVYSADGQTVATGTSPHVSQISWQ